MSAKVGISDLIVLKNLPCSFVAEREPATAFMIQSLQRISRPQSSPATHLAKMFVFAHRPIYFGRSRLDLVLCEEFWNKVISRAFREHALDQICTSNQQYQTKSTIESAYRGSSLKFVMEWFRSQTRIFSRALPPRPESSKPRLEFPAHIATVPLIKYSAQVHDDGKIEARQSVERA